jgi:hypothetical protein
MHPVADENGFFLESWQEIIMVRKPIIAAVGGYMVNTVSIHSSIAQVY